MSARPRTRPRRLAWLVLAVLALPVLMAGIRVVVHFSADFTDSGYTGPGDFFADGGVLKVLGPQDVFVLGEDGSGDGVLQVLPNPGANPATLVADLDAPAKADVLYVDFDIETFGDWSPLVVWLNDSDGGGMIDIVAEEPDPGDSPLRVGGVPVALPGLDPAEGKLHVRLTLKKPSLGAPFWTVVVSNGTVSTSAAGPLFTGGEQPSIGSLLIVRPGAAHGGSYEIDDVVISSQTGGLNSNL